MPTIGTIPTQPGELVRALLTVGEAGPNTSNRNWYRESTAVGSFSDDSDIEMSAGLGNINRVLWNLNNELRVFRSGSGSLITAIAAAGDLAGKSFFFATGDDAIDARFDVGADDVTAAAGRVQLVSDATVQAVFNAVLADGLVNIVIADTPVAPIAPIIETGGVDVEAGAPGVEATAEAVVAPDPVDVSGEVTAGAPGVSAEAEAVRGAPVDHDTAAGVELGAPGITADAEAVPEAAPIDVSGDVEAGAPGVEATARVVPVPSATNLQTCRMLAGAWMPRRARVAVMPILAVVVGPAEDLVRAICREICKQLPYYEYGESCIPADAAPTGTVGPEAGEHTPGAIVVSLDPNQSEPEWGAGSWEPAVSEIRLIVTQATTTDFSDLELFISRRADLRKVLSRLTGGIG